jgi:hypothetical protein
MHVHVFIYNGHEDGFKILRWYCGDTTEGLHKTRFENLLDQTTDSSAPVHQPKMMFIIGSVAPAQIDAAKDAIKSIRSLDDAYENILCFSVSSIYE